MKNIDCQAHKQKLNRASIIVAVSVVSLCLFSTESYAYSHRIKDVFNAIGEAELDSVARVFGGLITLIFYIIVLLIIYVGPFLLAYWISLILEGYFDFDLGVIKSATIYGMTLLIMIMIWSYFDWPFFG
jgi:hypothetical protein